MSPIERVCEVEQIILRHSETKCLPRERIGFSKDFSCHILGESVKSLSFFCGLIDASNLVQPCRIIDTVCMAIIMLILMSLLPEPGGKELE